MPVSDKGAFYVDCRDAGPPLIFFYCCTDVAGARSSTELTGRLPG